MISSTLLWIERLLALSILIQTVEFLSLRSLLSQTGIWRWSTVSLDFSGFWKPWPSIFSALLNTRVFEALLLLQLGAVLLSFFLPSAFIFEILFITNLLILLRWRGSFNGGSDFMTIVVLSAVCIAAASSETPRVQEGALWYITIQICSSYFISGLVKLRRTNWRAGQALSAFLKSSIYETPGLLKVITRSPTLSKLASWGVILFEVSFPLALLNQNIAWVYVLLGCIFHLGIFYAFGLNRFFFAWLAGYPALLYCSQRIH